MEISERAAKELNGRVVTTHDLLDRITAMIDAGKTQGEVAGELGVSPIMLHSVLHGRKEIGVRIPEKLGFERVVVWVRREKA